MSKLKLAILWEQWTGYWDACVRALVAKYPVEVLRCHSEPVRNAPFNVDDFLPCQSYMFLGQPSHSHLEETIQSFNPDALLVASWSRPAYRSIARRFEGRAIRIVGMDNQWHGTAKQWLGRLTSAYFVQRMFDRALVAGERQRRFARMLGFADSDIFEPLYCCDIAAFSRARPDFDCKSFLFVGRLVPEKAVDVLIEAYSIYRRASPSKPWDLVISGTGPLADKLGGVPGVRLEGFVQPADLPALFGQNSCFVLPSRFEPWGVVIHEAASVGLPIICSSSCGAADAFVEDGKNGWIISGSSPAELATAFAKIASIGRDDLEQMSKHSRQLATEITPERWADSVWALAGGRARLPQDRAL